MKCLLSRFKESWNQQYKVVCRVCAQTLSHFLPKGGGGANEIVWIIGGGGKYVSVCKAWSKLGGSGGILPQGNFGFLTF